MVEWRKTTLSGVAGIRHYNFLNTRVLVLAGTKIILLVSLTPFNPLFAQTTYCHDSDFFFPFSYVSLLEAT